MGDERPSLGGEYEVALAKVDVAQNLTFAEATYPPIVGVFEIVTCTKDIRVVPPAGQNKMIPNGYNPAAQVIPAPGSIGSLSFEGLDLAQSNKAMAYNGTLCVARLITRIDVQTVRTMYCNYFTPTIKLNAPAGDQEGTVSVEGTFATLGSP